MKRTFLLFLGSLILLLSVGNSSAQIPPDQEKIQMQPSFQEFPVNIGRSAQENLLSIGVLAFGLLFTGILTIVTIKCRAEKLFGMSYMKLVGLTLVITAGLFLICAGYSQDQIAPMIGLLGTIAGYLLGKGEAKEKE